MATFSLLAPAAGQQFCTRGGTTYQADGNAVVSGVALKDIRDLVSAGCIPLGTAVNDSYGWNENPSLPAVVAAIGATQGGAAQITTNRVIVTVTASTEGVKLLAVATGAETSIVVPGTVGTKVYPPTNCKIDALSTNSALALAAGKGSIFLQRDATRWVTKVKGA